MSSKNARAARLQSSSNGKHRVPTLEELLATRQPAVTVRQPAVAVQLLPAAQAKFDELCRQLLDVKTAIQQTQARAVELVGQDQQLQGRLRERLIMLAEANGLDVNTVSGSWDGEHFVVRQNLVPPVPVPVG